MDFEIFEFCVFDFEIKKYASKSSHRLVVSVNAAIGKIAVVDVEIDCTVEQAKALVDTVQPWWRASREPGVAAVVSKDIAVTQEGR